MSVEMLPAGRELDAEVHEALTGIKPVWKPIYRDERLEPFASWDGKSQCGRTISRYSADMAAAWLIVEHLMAKGFRVEIETRDPEFAEPFQVCVWAGAEAVSRHYAETAPLAICRAALRAVKGE